MSIEDITAHGGATTNADNHAAFASAWSAAGDGGTIEVPGDGTFKIDCGNMTPGQGLYVGQRTVKVKNGATLLLENDNTDEGALFALQKGDGTLTIHVEAGGKIEVETPGNADQADPLILAQRNGSGTDDHVVIEGGGEVIGFIRAVDGDWQSATIKADTKVHAEENLLQIGQSPDSTAGKVGVFVEEGCDIAGRIDASQDLDVSVRGTAANPINWRRGDKAGNKYGLHRHYSYTGAGTSRSPEVLLVEHVIFGDDAEWTAVYNKSWSTDPYPLTVQDCESTARRFANVYGKTVLRRCKVRDGTGVDHPIRVQTSGELWSQALDVDTANAYAVYLISGVAWHDVGSKLHALTFAAYSLSTASLDVTAHRTRFTCDGTKGYSFRAAGDVYLDDVDVPGAGEHLASGKLADIRRSRFGSWAGTLGELRGGNTAGTFTLTNVTTTTDWEGEGDVGETVGIGTLTVDPIPPEIRMASE